MLKAANPVIHQSFHPLSDSPSPAMLYPPRSTSLIKPATSLDRPSASESSVPILGRQLPTSTLATNPPVTEHHPSMARLPLFSPKKRPSSSQRPQSSIWPVEVPPATPTKSFSPKEYLTAVSNLVSFASRKMGEVNLPDMIWAFNRAHARNDRTAMHNLAVRMAPTLQAVQVAYRNFRTTRETFGEEDIWNMVIGLGEDGSKFWDVVEELNDLVDIMEGKETLAFWKSLESVAKG